MAFWPFLQANNPLNTVQIMCNVPFARAHGFARDLIIAEGGGVAPVLLVSVHPWVCFVISASETGATSKSASAGECDVAQDLYHI